MTNSFGSEYPWGKVKSSEMITHEAQDDHPEATSFLSDYTTSIELEDRVPTWQGLWSFRSDQENFYYEYTKRFLKDRKLVREKTWKETIPRDHQ